MIELAQRLRVELARSAETVRPAPDPVGRLLARRRQRHARRSLGAITAVVLGLAGVVATGGVLTTAGPPAPGPSITSPAPSGPPDAHDEITSPWTRQLLAGPTRGNRAGDKALIADLTAHLAGRQMLGWGVDPAQNRVKVLLVDDNVGFLVYWAAFYNDTRADIAEGVGLPGETVAQMLASGRGGGSVPLSPFVYTAFGADMPGIGSWDYAAALAPPGCQIATSDEGTLGPTGTVTRAWTDRGEYIVRRGDSIDGWMRVTCAGVVREMFTHSADRPMPVPLSGAAVTERGYADPALVTRAMAQWRPLPGVKVDRYRVLWGGTPPGATEPTVVVTGETSGGGVLVCALTGTAANVGLTTMVAGGANVNAHDETAGPPTVASVTTATAASTALITIRLPDLTVQPVLSDRLLVIAPAGATGLHIAGSGSPPVPLTDGVGVITAKIPANLTIQATDGNGHTLAEATVAEPNAAGLVFGQPILNRW